MEEGESSRNNLMINIESYLSAGQEIAVANSEKMAQLEAAGATATAEGTCGKLAESRAQHLPNELAYGVNPSRCRCSTRINEKTHKERTSRSRRRATESNRQAPLFISISLTLLVLTLGYPSIVCANGHETSPTVEQQKTAAAAAAAAMEAEQQQVAATTSTMTLAAGASIQHQESLMGSKQSGQEPDLDNSINGGVSSAPSSFSTSSGVAATHNFPPPPPMVAPGQVLPSLEQPLPGPGHTEPQPPLQLQLQLQGNGNRFRPAAAYNHHWNSAGVAHQISATNNHIGAANKKGASTWQNQNLNKLQKYLSEHQQELVKQNPGSLLAVARAIKMAIVECQYQMRNEPWDCPIYGFSIKPAEIFGMLMSRSFKETSFIQSLLSSAIAHSVARACTESTISTCSRKQSSHGNGFSEDIEFGRQFAQKFMDVTHELQSQQQREQHRNSNSNDLEHRQAAAAVASIANNVHEQQLRPSSGHHSVGPIWKERRLRYMINAHNDEVGRLLVLNGMRRECKCHGLSGACSIQTCWLRLPPFREVANRLHDSLDQALRVEMYVAPQGSSSSMNRHKSLTSTATTYRKSNKKRSSSTHQSSSSVNPPLNGLGRSMAAATQASVHAATLTTSSASSIKVSGRDGSEMLGTSGSRLQAFQQDGPTAAAGTTSGNNNLNGQTDGSLDSQSPREIAHNSFFTSSTPASPLMNATTVIKRRPIARSIGLTASTITPSKFDLLYAEESPDFCVPSERYNIKGTKGRICSESLNVSNSCERLCCGRGYRTEIREEKYKCDCKFQFCCKLQCNSCTRQKIIHKCL